MTLGKVLLAAGLLLATTVAFWLKTPEPMTSDAKIPDTSISATSTKTETFVPDIATQTDDLPGFTFIDVTNQSGIDFTYYGNPSPQHYMTEQNGGGVSLLDIDGDGQLDLYFSNGSHFEYPAEEAAASHRCYRCVGEWVYEDVTHVCGLQAFGFGMGTAAADYDNDGFVDLFVCCYGRNRLWRNNGDGTYSEVTDACSVGDSRWAASAAFADLDNDGNLDLYVVNYVDYDQSDPDCYTQHEPPVHISCGPIGRTGQADILYQNTGDGSFIDVSETAGIAIAEQGKGLAVEIVDLDDDGLLDVYVANDTTANFLFRNLGNMRFDELALLRNVAVGEDGAAQSGMGIACADYNADGRFDLFVTNFEGAVNDVYENLGEVGFRSRNFDMGLDTTSRPRLAFGTVFADFDLDQWPDLFVANGHIWDLTPLNMGHEYQMQPQVFRNLNGRRFTDVSSKSGSYFERKWLGRAAAVGDLDNDGDPDLVIGQLLEPNRLLRNDCDHVGGSMRLKLVGTTAARQAAGIRIEAVMGEVTTALHSQSGGSFQATGDDRIIVSTGEYQSIDELRVFWSPDHVEVWRDVPVSDQLVLIQNSQE